MAVFYRQYRPQKFSDLVGQEPIAKALLGQLESSKFSHGYLFYGPRGTGKTSTARIFAKAVNCFAFGKAGDKLRRLKLGEPCNKCVSCTSITAGSHLDLIEIDAASNRGIDEIRDLREKIKLSPILSRFKVYIIDEAHMLTTEAFNALLKTLEEPPAHAIFILCTTEVGKLPATIVSRLQKFYFARAKSADLDKVILKISKLEGIKIDNVATAAIAQAADGSYRDAVSMFDQLAANSKTIKVSDVAGIAKIGGWEHLYKFAKLVCEKDLKGTVILVEELAREGADISFFAKQAVLFFEKLLFIKIGIEEGMLDDLSSDQIERMRELCGAFERDELQTLMKQFLVAESEIRIYPLPQIPLVLVLCKFIGRTESSEGLNKDDLEDKVESQKVIQEEAAQQKVDLSKSTKAGNSNSGSMKQIEKNWDKFINKVKPLNAHVVALLKSARPIDFDGKVLTMEVFYRFHKEKLEEPKIIRILDEVMEEVLNKNIKFKFMLATSGAKPPRTVSRSDVVEINSEDLAQMTQEIFSK